MCLLRKSLVGVVDLISQVHRKASSDCWILWLGSAHHKDLVQKAPLQLHFCNPCDIKRFYNFRVVSRYHRYLQKKTDRKSMIYYSFLLVLLQLSHCIKVTHSFHCAVPFVWETNPGIVPASQALIKASNSTAQHRYPKLVEMWQSGGL